MHALIDGALTIDQLTREIIACCRREDEALFDSLAFIADFDLRRGWQLWGCFDCAHWLVMQCGLGRSTAKERVRVAHALGSLPQIEAALRRGDLSYSKVRALTRVATDLNEAWLLEEAFRRTAPQLERWVRRLRHADAVLSTPDALRAYERRHVSVYRREDGVGVLTAELPEEDLEVVRQALTFVAAGLPEIEGQSVQARQASALVQMARDCLNGGAGDGKAGDNYLVVAHVDYEALQDNGCKDAAFGITGASTGDIRGATAGDAPSVAASGSPESDLPIETVRRLSCDGALLGLVKNADGVPLAVGRKTRAIPLAIQRALEARDPTCRFPGCAHSRWLDGHHIVHWSSGGRTDLANLIRLCDHHHRMIHEGGFGIRRVRAAPEQVYFTRPDGTPIEIDERVVTVAVEAVSHGDGPMGDGGPVLTEDGDVASTADQFVSTEDGDFVSVGHRAAGSTRDGPAGDRGLEVREVASIYGS